MHITMALGRFCRAILAPTTMPVMTLLALAPASSALASPPAADLFFAIDNGDEKHDLVSGVSAGNGNQVYIASYTAADGSWLITYNITCDYTTNPQTSVTGIVTVENKTDRDILEFRVGVNIPVCPMIEGGSLLGGSALLTLTTNGPGTVACGKEGLPIFRGSADGHGIGSIFYCPTTLTSTGSSMISYTGTYGLPGITLSGPEAVGTIGFIEDFILTAKDKVSMQFTVFFKDADGVPPRSACEMDVNGDGLVGPADLAEVFAEWGVTDPCPAMLLTDFNDDGLVDATDLMILLNAWGDCG